MRPATPISRSSQRFSYLPVLPVSGSGRAVYQPIWAEDVVQCVMAALGERATPHAARNFELAGPETLSYDAMVRTAVRPLGRQRPLLHVPLPVVRTSLRALHKLVGPPVFATWEEAELMEEPMTTARGTADAESLGVKPLRMNAVLGSA